MIRLVKTDFRRWLKRNERVLVGSPIEFSSCPFCKYLRSRGAKRVHMTIGYRVVDGRTHTHSAWQRQFQNEAIKLEKSLDVVGLRGREALQVLDSV